MSVLCIDEQGASLGRKDERLIVKKDDNVISDIPAFRIEQILIMGTVQITADAMKLIFRNGIDTVFLSLKGKFYGRIYSPNLMLVKNRITQLQKLHDEDYLMRFVKSVISGKLCNFRNLLLRFNRGKNKQISESCFIIRNIIKNLEKAESRESALGYEGAGSAAYFRGFKELLKQDMGFHGRQKRPPVDPVNSMLSFGYMLLFREISLAVNLSGADPYTGFLHTPDNNRESLALDLMEEFRHLVDGVVLNLVNRREVARENFIVNNDGSVKMSKSVIGLLMRKFYDRLEEEAQYPRFSENHSLKMIIRHQAKLFVKSVRDEEEYSYFELV